MSCPFHSNGPRPSRRGLLAAAGGLAAAGISRAARADRPAPMAGAEPFYGPHQAGIATPQPPHSYFAAFDLVTAKRDDVVAMLRAWTDAAARLTAGQTAKPMGQDLTVAAPDGGTALDLAPGHLTLTFGFGPGLFVKDGKDRYGLAAQRPQALVDMPRFNGDELQPERTGGDISVHACADDPQIAFHAVRELTRLAYDAAQLRWAQSGFLPDVPNNQTPRNLMGFKDGTNNAMPGAVPTAEVPKTFDEVVWVGDEGPAWMRGGSYQVVRRIRISLEHWDRTGVDLQEEVIGRHKYSGAPIGKTHETDLLELDRADKDGNPVIADSAHVRLGAPAMNDGAQIMRRGYSYNDGVSFTAERWPPWRQGMLYDSGLFFIAYQRDPRTGFIKIYQNMSKLDAMNQYTTHTGGGLFACLPGVREGEYIGQKFFDSAPV
ncbi:MAG TPA: iron uptake transporter deferrochelatase/peroxidase subunit [Acetobacteraceae bacterium]